MFTIQITVTVTVESELVVLRKSFSKRILLILAENVDENKLGIRCKKTPHSGRKS